MALLKYLRTEGPVVKCDALSRKKTEHVNERLKQAGEKPGEPLEAWSASEVQHEAQCDLRLLRRLHV